MLSKQYSLILSWEPPPEKDNIEYLEAIRDSQDKEVSWNFVLLNARFVVNVINRGFLGFPMSDEMLSDGLLGFFNATMRVKDISTFFSGYAEGYIRGYVYKGLYKRRGRKRHNDVWDNGPLSYDYISQDANDNDHGSVRQYYDATACLPNEIVMADDNKKEAKSIIKKIMSKAGLSKKQKEAFVAFTKCNTVKDETKVQEDLGITRQALWVRKSKMNEKIHFLVSNDKKLKKRIQELLAK